MGDSVSEAIICKKARLLHADLAKKMPGTSADVSEFKASRRWFDKFKKHKNIRNGKTARGQLNDLHEAALCLPPLE